MNNLKSPCYGVCTYDSVGINKRCIGCLRSDYEIKNWLKLSEAERKKIWEKLGILGLLKEVKDFMCFFSQEFRDFS